MLFAYPRRPINQVKKAGKTEGRWDGERGLFSVKVVGFVSTKEEKQCI
jgi:hypothetical protein